MRWTVAWFEACQAWLAMPLLILAAPAEENCHSNCSKEGSSRPQYRVQGTVQGMVIWCHATLGAIDCRQYCMAYSDAHQIAKTGRTARQSLLIKAPDHVQQSLLSLQDKLHLSELPLQFPVCKVHDHADAGPCGASQ